MPGYGRRPLYRVRVVGGGDACGRQRRTATATATAKALALHDAGGGPGRCRMKEEGVSCSVEPSPCSAGSTANSSRAWARLYKKRAAKLLLLLLLLFFFLFGGWKQPETVRGRAGWVHGVSREPTPPGQARLLLYATNRPPTRGCAVRRNLRRRRRLLPKQADRQATHHQHTQPQQGPQQPRLPVTLRLQRRVTRQRLRAALQARQRRLP